MGRQTRPLSLLVGLAVSGALSAAAPCPVSAQATATDAAANAGGVVATESIDDAHPVNVVPELPSDAETAFVAWARTHAVPLPGPDADPAGLDVLAPVLAGARVVAFGEPTHGAHEPLAFRNQLARYLVEHQGFTAIAIESGLTESRRLDDYVNGAPGDEHRIVRDNFTWGFGEYSENLALVRWLRAWNMAPGRTRKVRLYGIDLPGGAGASLPDARIALDDLLAWFERNAHPRTEAIRATITPLLDAFSQDRYASMSEADRQHLRSALADAIVILERIDSDDQNAGRGNDTAWALRNARTARHLQDFFEAWPTGTGGTELGPGMVEPMEIRDRAMAEHVQWILQREGADGRVLVFAHNAHVVDEPIRGGIWNRLGPSAPRLMGTHLRAALGDGLRILASSGSAGPGEPAKADLPEIDRALSRVGVPHFLLDVQAARENPAFASWLDQPRTLRANETTEIELIPSRAFDGLVYFDQLTPAGNIGNDRQPDSDE